MRDVTQYDKEVQRLGRAYREEAIRLAKEVDSSTARLNAVLACLIGTRDKISQVITEISGGTK